MSGKILFDPHHFLVPVKKLLQEKYNVDFLLIGNAIKKYASSNHNGVFKATQMSFSNQFISSFPSWFAEHINGFKDIFFRSICSNPDNFIQHITQISLYKHNLLQHLPKLFVKLPWSY